MPGAYGVPGLALPATVGSATWAASSSAALHVLGGGLGRSILDGIQRTHPRANAAAVLADFYQQMVSNGIRQLSAMSWYSSRSVITSSSCLSSDSLIARSLWLSAAKPMLVNNRPRLPATRGACQGGAGVGAHVVGGVAVVRLVGEVAMPENGRFRHRRQRPLIGF